MARPRVANPKLVSVTVKMSQRELAALDANRGGLSRSGYLRMLGTKSGRPAVAPTEPTSIIEPATTRSEADSRHLHRYVRGEQLRFERGVAIYRHRCQCGAEKEDR